MLAHCHRELTHEQWKILLDNDFLYAYEHGIVLDCGDGQQRRFYPRIFTYSADYCEKWVLLLEFNIYYVTDPCTHRVVMASIRNMGNCPCPRCKIRLSDAMMVGTASDRQVRQENKRFDDTKRQEAVDAARKAIFQQNLAVDSAFVERQLKDDSLVPSFVSHRCWSKQLLIEFLSRMPFPTAYPNLDLIYFQCFLLI